MALENSPEAELLFKPVLAAVVPLLFSVSMLELVPYLKPVSDIVPVAPVKEADRVAPVALLSGLEPVVTVAVAVWPPGVPPPDCSHSAFTPQITKRFVVEVVNLIVVSAVILERVNSK